MRHDMRHFAAWANVSTSNIAINPQLRDDQ
jgi:hypothetical protein